ncbi:hypothetical protein D9M68_468640 [compost metagenome]
MADYQEKTVNGTSWKRCRSIYIDNPRPHLGAPSVQFNEERVVSFEGVELVSPDGMLTEGFTPDNALTEFNLLHPDTGAVLGTATFTDAYVMLASLYRHLAEKRDAAAALAATE